MKLENVKTYSALHAELIIHVRKPYFPDEYVHKTSQTAAGDMEDLRREIIAAINNAGWEIVPVL
jgi:hypothetical protein